MDDLFWWTKHLIIGGASLFFLLLGVDALIHGYQSNNPQIFLMYFFSSNLMILISAVGLAYPVIKIYGRFRPKNNMDQQKPQGNNR